MTAATPDTSDIAVDPDAVIAAALIPDPDAPDADGQPWEVRSHRAADWCVARIRSAHEQFHQETAHLRDALDALEQRAAEIREHIDGRAEQRDRTVEFMEGRLVAWLRHLRADAIAAGDDPDKAPKSVTLTGGKVRSRAGRDRVEVADAATVAKWAADNDAATVAWWEPKVDRRAVARYVKADGVVPAGVDFQPATEDERTYSVEVS